MEINHRGLQGTVTQVLLDQAQVHASLEQMCRVTVPQRVDRDPLAKAKLLHHAFHRAVNTGTRHGFCGRGGFIVIASRRWKDPDRVAMSGPV